MLTVITAAIPGILSILLTERIPEGWRAALAKLLQE